VFAWYLTICVTWPDQLEVIRTFIIYCDTVVDNKPLKIIDDDADNDDIDDNDNHSTSCVILFME